MSGQHTPGPWWTEPVGTVRNDADGEPRYDLPRIVRYGDGVSICKTHLIGGADPDPAIANARLMAAAPDLLAALEGLLADIQDYQRINNLGGESNHWQVHARAAIAKARA